jgi:hypothetical protein
MFVVYPVFQAALIGALFLESVGERYTPHRIAGILVPALVVAILIEVSRILPVFKFVKSPLLWRGLTFAAVVAVLVMVFAPAASAEVGLVMPVLLALHLAFLRQGLYAGDEGRVRRLMDVLIVLVIAAPLIYQAVVA